VLGGLFGAAVVYGNYASAIDIFEGGHGIRTRATGGLFATYAVSRFGCLYSACNSVFEPYRAA
jgi:hypothetical protein